MPLFAQSRTSGNSDKISFAQESPEILRTTTMEKLPLRSKPETIIEKQPGEADLGGQTDFLPIPQINDCAADVALKLTALADVVRHGRSIAIATGFAASMTQEREPMSIAVNEMIGHEHDAWTLYTTGEYPLPKIDWISDHEPPPTSTKPLRIARRRAEALNRLYKTDQAGPGHSVWFTKHEIDHLDLVKAMVRVIGAERNLVGGQDALSVTQLADLQTINTVLSVSSEISKSSRDKLTSMKISSAQQVLGCHREVLRRMLGGDDRKERKCRSEA
ncbi:MAG: hypothetical protein M1820_005316 [Bogoriella megaspora]|nr:MAG: hypothetical protein M1820_005316 [Bogoriella megaspora]